MAVEVMKVSKASAVALKGPVLGTAVTAELTDACDWIEQYAEPSYGTAMAREIFACIKPPKIPWTQRNLTLQRKSTDDEQQAPSMTRKHSHEEGYVP